MQQALTQVYLTSVSFVRVKNLSERLWAAMNLRSPPVTKAELSRAAKVSTAAVNGWFKNGNVELKATQCFLLARKLGVDAEWLARGIGTMRPNDKASRLARKDQFIHEADGFSPESVRLVADLIAELRRLSAREPTRPRSPSVAK